MLTAPLRTAHSVRASTAVRFRAPRRVKPSDAAAAVLRTEKGPWLPDLTPYLLEPLDLLGSREYRSVIFVGPARTGKTMTLILGGIAYVVTCAPGDMLVVQMSQDAARDFSRMDLDRAIRHSPELASRISPRARDDNTFDKFFRSGIALKLGWPAVSQLSSKTLQYVFLTDYDRPENAQNVDGEGPLFDLASKRTETYMSRGKTVAESSPGEDYADAKYVRRGNEAPPARGILSLYNSGTRARWHWPCQHCGERFEAQPGLGCFAMPDFDELVKLVERSDLMSLAEQFARVGCPHCGATHEPTQRSAMNAGGRWLHEGETFVDGQVVGERRRTTSASYWLGGVSAAYQTWPSVVHSYLAAVLTYVRTGDEGPLKKTTNTDQGAAYIPRAAVNRRSADHLMDRLETWERGTAPEGVRFITTAVDVQAHRFRVNVFGWGVGLQSWLIERFQITRSTRKEGDGFAGVDPASYVEDWEQLVALPDLARIEEDEGAAGERRGVPREQPEDRRLPEVGRAQRVAVLAQQHEPALARRFVDTAVQSEVDDVDVAEEVLLDLVDEWVPLLRRRVGRRQCGDLRDRTGQRAPSVPDAGVVGPHERRPVHVDPRRIRESRSGR